MSLTDYVDMLRCDRCGCRTPSSVMRRTASSTTSSSPTSTCASSPTATSCTASACPSPSPAPWTSSCSRWTPRPATSPSQATAGQSATSSTSGRWALYSIFSSYFAFVNQVLHTLINVNVNVNLIPKYDLFIGQNMEWSRDSECWPWN